MKIIKIVEDDIINIAADVKVVSDSYELVGIESDVTPQAMLHPNIGWVINYAQLKDCYQYLGKTFATESDDIKDAIVKHCAISQSECITYLTSKGMDLATAITTYIGNRSEDIINLISVCSQNAKTTTLLKVLFKYFDQPTCEEFLKATKDLVFFYSNYAIYGKKYGNAIDGLLDFIEDYGTYAGSGLSTYTVREGTLLADLIADLKTVLTNGRCNISM